ncbi:MAG TPA: hypothetical protein VKR06_27625 [Ktedonosporobacter sp.]|nr:hypothetical protein [Ktedonosporobacter sp.]
MATNQPPCKRWNLFARELDDILQAHNLSMADLATKAELHSEKVRRLKLSLSTPRFNLLSPEDLDHVIAHFQFTIEEQLRLRAAILATAVEETLMDRIDPENALKAAEEIFPILLDALRKRLGQEGIGKTRGESMRDEAAIDDLLDIALKRYDQAMIALYLSQQGDTQTERIEQLRRAREGFAAALAELEALKRADSTIAESETWQMWYEEAHNGLAQAQQ